MNNANFSFMFEPIHQNCIRQSGIWLSSGVGKDLISKIADLQVPKQIESSHVKLVFDSHPNEVKCLSM